MISGFEIVITEDGSPTLYSDQFKATYHSQKGALEESMHVFIKNGFEVAKIKFNSLNVLEVGFGTGLNALLTLHHAGNNSVYYHTIEKIPIPESIYKQLNYPGENYWNLHSCDWNKDIRITPNFTLHKTNSGIESIDLPQIYNLIYMDAFAPSTQQDIWQADILKKLYDCLVPDGILVTFCAKGQFKRDLRTLGFTVESPMGAPGKREMTRAIK